MKIMPTDYLTSIKLVHLWKKCKKKKKNLTVIENPNKPSIVKVEVSSTWVQGYFELLSDFSDSVL